MATYWISTLGNDGNPGTSYDSGSGPGSGAKLTFPAAIPLLNTQGDILNVVNDGNHTWPTGTTGTNLVLGTSGTSFSIYGQLIRGTTTTGTPALSTISASGADGIRTIVRIRHDTGFLLFRNIVFDATGKTGDVSSYHVVTFHDDGSPEPDPVRFEGCVWLGGGTGIRPDGIRDAVRISATPPLGIPYAEFQGCYFQNCRGEVVSGDSNAGGLQKTFDNCLVIQNWTTNVNERFFGFSNHESASGLLRVKNCTFYEVIGNNTAVGVIDYAPDNGTSVGTVDVYNNVVFMDSTNADPDILFFEGTIGATVTKNGTIGFNVLLGGPNTAIGDISDTQGWYEQPWDLGTDPMITDTAAYSQVEATVFNAPGSTYAWDPIGNGVTITILKDLRLLLFTTAGQGASLPGALPGIAAPITDLAIDIAASTLNPKPLEVFTVTITLTNTIVNETGVECSVVIPVGIFYLTSLASAGSYNPTTGAWMVGNFNAGASATLVLTLRPLMSAANQTIVFPVSISAFNPPSDSDMTNNTDSITLLIDTIEKKITATTGPEKIIPLFSSTGEKIVDGIAPIVSVSSSVADGDVARTETTTDLIPSEV